MAKATCYNSTKTSKHKYYMRLGLVIRGTLCESSRPHQVQSHSVSELGASPMRSLSSWMRWHIAESIIRPRWAISSSMIACSVEPVGSRSSVLITGGIGGVAGNSLRRLRLARVMPRTLTRRRLAAVPRLRGLSGVGGLLQLAGGGVLRSKSDMLCLANLGFEVLAKYGIWPY